MKALRRPGGPLRDPRSRHLAPHYLTHHNLLFSHETRTLREYDITSILGSVYYQHMFSLTRHMCSAESRNILECASFLFVLLLVLLLSLPLVLVYVYRYCPHILCIRFRFRLYSFHSFFLVLHFSLAGVSVLFTLITPILWIVTTDESPGDQLMYDIQSIDQDSKEGNILIQVNP